MVAPFDDGSAFEYEDLVSISYGGQAVGDDDAGPAFHELVHAGLNVFFGAAVDGTGGFVEDEDGWVSDGGPGDVQELTLALAQVVAVAFQDGLVALGQSLDKGIGADQFGGVDDLFVCRFQPAIPDIFQDGAGEKMGVL